MVKSSNGKLFRGDQVDQETWVILEETVFLVHLEDWDSLVTGGKTDDLEKM